MQLTKTHIQDITNRLKHNGVTYWDIRVELVDHIVSLIEADINNGVAYKTALENAFTTLNLQGNLQVFTRQQLFAVNKIIRKRYSVTIMALFTKLAYVKFVVLYVFAHLIFFLLAPYKLFVAVSLTLFAVPLVFGMFLYFKEFLQRRTSAYLTYTSFYIFFAFLMLQLPVHFLKPDVYVNLTEPTYKLLLLVVVAINTICATAGILVHLKTIKNIKTTFKTLI